MSSRLKCVACPNLERQTVQVKGRDLVVFDCGEVRFPYKAALSGLLRPSPGIAQAAENCQVPRLLPGRCVVCKKEGEVRFGRDFGTLCKEHDRAWRAWLDEHQGKRDYFAPRGRVIHARWIEVFWEFVASAREVGNEGRDREYPI